MMTATLRLRSNKTFTIATNENFNLDLLNLLESADDVVAYKISIDGSELKQSGMDHFFPTFAAAAGGKLVLKLHDDQPQ